LFEVATGQTATFLVQTSHWMTSYAAVSHSFTMRTGSPRGAIIFDRFEA
jgi:hypothetical protein